MDRPDENACGVETKHELDVQDHRVNVHEIEDAGKRHRKGIEKVDRFVEEGKQENVLRIVNLTGEKACVSKGGQNV